MKPTLFARRFSKKTGILELMDDLGRAVQGRTDMLMLGGGNPAHIPAVNEIWRRRTAEIMAGAGELEEMLSNYDTPQGKHVFLESLAGLLRREFGWDVNAENIAVTNGSQTASFLLLNLLCGTGVDGVFRKALFPVCPEYIGYADQTVEEGALAARPGRIELTRPGFFKYRVDFDGLEPAGDIGALCVSRPTNPTGNVLTDGEIRRLAGITRERGIPFLIDNAYGAPFPNILFREAEPYWDDNVVLSMSLSKLGLPSVRTGIVVAEKSLIEAVSACNAVISLASGSIGQVLVKPLIDSGEILSLSREVIRPFYRRRSAAAIEALREAFGDDVPYRIHESEGSIFLWLWFPELPIDSSELYERLKTRGVLVVSGHYFFYGLEEPWDHSKECLRLSYALEPSQFRKAAMVIADEVRKVMGQ